MTEKILAAENFDPQESRERLADFLVKRFLHDECDIGPKLSVRAGDLQASFTAWCEARRFVRLSSNAFAQRLTRRFEKDTSGRHRVYHGLKLKGRACDPGNQNRAPTAGPEAA